MKEKASFKLLIRPGLLMCLLLAIPIIPFLVFGTRVEGWAEQWSETQTSPAWFAFTVICLLAGDVFLPIPSSMITTYSGWHLGGPLGTGASWCGMTVGAILGFAIARVWGKPLALWFSNEGELEQMHALSQRFGPPMLIICRGIPVLAEASVLLMGINRLTWRAFLPPIMLSNLGLSLAYAWLGDISQRNGWLPLALSVSIALPVLIGSIARWWLSCREATGDHENPE